jgi:hypothetical protein
MGRTLRTATQIVLDEQQAFASFRRALRSEDRLACEAMFAGARKHLTAISQAAHVLPFEAILLAMLVEEYKEVLRLRQLIDEAVLR